MRLRGRVLVLLLVSILPALAIQGYNENVLRQSREDDIRQRVIQITKQFGEEMGELREGARQMLVALGNIPAVQAGDAKTCDAVFSSLKQRFDNYAVLGAADMQGRVFCSSANGGMASIANVAFFKLAVKDDRLAVGNYFVDPTNGKKLIHFALRFLGPTGQPAGVVFAGLDLAWLSEHLKERGLTPTQSILIADRLGNIIARLPHPEELVGKNMRKTHEKIMDGNTAGWEEAKGVDGITRIFGYVPAQLFPYDFFLSAGQEKGEVLAPIRTATLHGIELIGLGFVLAVIGAWIGSRAFVERPIGTLLQAIGEWRKGNLKARADIDTGTEIGDLAAAFNSMADALAKQVEAQQRAEDDLRRLNATLEERVSNRTEDLARANEKLQQEMKEREKAQADLLQAQKIEAIGRLTSGIAHDFNNLLTAVLGNLDVARRRSPDERTARAIETATRAAKRGARLVGDLLAFSRRQKLDPESVAVNELLDRNAEMLRRAIGSTVRVTLSLDEDLWPAVSSSAQLELAILNLAINARDAMPDGGTVTLSTANLAKGAALLPPDLDDCVMVAVSDTGIGMTEEVQRRAVEPFFTTKEIGKGTGLGLSMVYGFVQQCGGRVRIDSAVGEGTRVAMFFPRATNNARTNAEDQAGIGATPIENRPGARILVVDDDQEVREFTASALTDAGYKVLTAADAPSALAIIETESDLALLIADLSMPLVSGLALLKEVQRERPHLPALLVTGLADPPLHGFSAGKNRILQKPFDLDELLRRVAGALDGRPTADTLPNVA